MIADIVLAETVGQAAGSYLGHTVQRLDERVEWRRVLARALGLGEGKPMDREDRAKFLGRRTDKRPPAPSSPR
jgi:hypothetical protein